MSNEASKDAAGNASALSGAAKGKQPVSAAPAGSHADTDVHEMADASDVDDNEDDGEEDEDGESDEDDLDAINPADIIESGRTRGRRIDYTKEAAALPETAEDEDEEEDPDFEITEAEA